MHVAQPGVEDIAVESFISTEAEVVMGSPGPNPALTGRDAIVAVLRQIVPMSAGPNGGKEALSSVAAHLLLPAGPTRVQN